MIDLDELTGRLTAALGPRGLTINAYHVNSTFNMTVKNVAGEVAREMTADDVDAFRAVLEECGYVEEKSWVARQGVSWLSDGVFAGVSFKVTPA